MRLWGASVVMVLVGATACGNDGAGESSSPPDAGGITIEAPDGSASPDDEVRPSTTLPPRAAPDGSVVSSSVLPYEPHPITAPADQTEWHQVPHRWDAGTRVSVDGRDLTFSFVGGAEYVPDAPCTEDYRVEIEETATEVRAELWVRRGGTADDDPACRDIGYMRTATATLADRLGERTVVLVPDDVDVEVS